MGDLKICLRHFGLSLIGNKDELMERVLRHIEKEEEVHQEEEDEEGEQEEEVEVDEEKEKEMEIEEEEQDEEEITIEKLKKMKKEPLRELCTKMDIQYERGHKAEELINFIMMKKK